MLRRVLASPLLPVARHHAPPSFSTALLSRRFATENKQNNDQVNENASSDQATNTTGSNVSETNGSEVSDMEKLQKELEEKNTQIAELNDRSLRAYAEMENVRMIARRDVENARKYAIVPFAKSILNIADNLGLALNSIDKNELESANNENDNNLLKGLYFGVQATESEMLKVFSQYGISRFGDVGDKFDPNKYQAMFEAPSEQYEPGTVITVQKLGYQMEERILRPAEVGVSKAP